MCTSMSASLLTVPSILLCYLYDKSIVGMCCVLLSAWTVEKYFNVLLHVYGINLNMCLGVKNNPSSFFSPKLDIDPDLIVFMYTNCYWNQFGHAGL